MDEKYKQGLKEAKRKAVDKANDINKPVYIMCNIGCFWLATDDVHFNKSNAIEVINPRKSP